MLQPLRCAGLPHKPPNAPPALLVIAQFLIELLFLLLCLLSLFFSVVLFLHSLSKSEQMLLLEEGSESDPLDESIEDDPSREEENILYCSQFQF